MALWGAGRTSYHAGRGSDAEEEAGEAQLLATPAPGRRELARKLGAMIALGLTLVALLVGVLTRPAILRGHGSESLRLAQQGATCSELVYIANFGAGERDYPIPEGSGTTERACPQGSPIAGGRMRFECLPSGLWRVTHTCFDCAAESNVPVKYTSRLQTLVDVRPGVHGDAIEQPCEFDDGTNFSFGRIKIICANQSWNVKDATCRDTTCPDRRTVVRVNLQGASGAIVGRMPIDLEGAMPGNYSYPCPFESRNITFECTEEGEWDMLDEEC